MAESARPVHARAELILGGQKSGKSRRAETLALQWLQAHDRHEAVLLATAEAWDDEMRQRIERHRRDRAERVPGMSTQETGLDLGAELAACSRPHRLVVVDCLTLWLTRLQMPAQGPAHDAAAPMEALCRAVRQAPGPVVLVGNEIGLGVIPMGREVRAFVDALGLLNQSVAAACDRVTLMAAGLPISLKEPA